jgi:hypothetical protein
VISNIFRNDKKEKLDDKDEEVSEELFKVVQMINEGNIEGFKSIYNQLGGGVFFSLRGYKSRAKVFGVDCSTKQWNPLTYAIYAE